jgi:hypothetical protein
MEAAVLSNCTVQCSQAASTSVRRIWADGARPIRTSPFLQRKALAQQGPSHRDELYFHAW